MRSLGWKPPACDVLSATARLSLPGREECVHAFDEGDELGMLVNGGFDGLFGDGQIEVAGAVGFE